MAAKSLPEISWRRRLPHFQLSAGYYFITFTTHKRQALSPAQMECVFDAIRFWDGNKYELLAVVVLHDHVHMLLNPAEGLSEIMHSIKSFTAHRVNKVSGRTGRVWQGENYDRAVRDEREFLEKVNYIANNPVKANLAARCEDYKWLYVKGWIND